MTDLSTITERSVKRIEAMFKPQPAPRLFPLDMSEQHVRERAKAFGLYGEARTAREWHEKCVPWIRAAR